MTSDMYYALPGLDQVHHGTALAVVTDFEACLDSEEWIENQNKIVEVVEYQRIALTPENARRLAENLNMAVAQEWDEFLWFNNEGLVTPTMPDEVGSSIRSLTKTIKDTWFRYRPTGVVLRKTLEQWLVEKPTHTTLEETSP